jgi:NAD(P)-dependent dehydrogenase (short-subunit alcohol dehydrogenase family)
MSHTNPPLDSATDTDPRVAGPKPEYPQQPLDVPGSDADLTPLAYHGEESYVGHWRLKGKTALITGGDSGIGRAVAIAFAREGADVAISYLPVEAEDAEETRRWIAASGQRAMTIPGDITQQAHCQHMVAEVLGTFGHLDVLVNNAAFQTTHESIEEFSTEELDRTFRTNVYATFWLSQAALPAMKSGNSIINTASIQAFDPSPNLLAYAATKAAIVNFSKGLSRVAMKRGIRVNVVAPGPVWTPLIPSTMPQERVRTFGADTVFGRAAQPVEIAPLFVFLASEEARFVTGEVYGATGGQTPY